MPPRPRQRPGGRAHPLRSGRRRGRHLAQRRAAVILSKFLKRLISAVVTAPVPILASGSHRRHLRPHLQACGRRSSRRCRAPKRAPSPVRHRGLWRRRIPGSATPRGATTLQWLPLSGILSKSIRCRACSAVVLPVWRSEERVHARCRSLLTLLCGAPPLLGALPAFRLAHAAFNKSYSWMLFGDDDTVFVTENVLRMLRRLQLDPSVPYILTDDQASADGPPYGPLHTLAGCTEWFSERSCLRPAPCSPSLAACYSTM